MIFFNTFVCIVLSLEWYCLHVLKFIEFKTPHENGFLVFDVPDTKYLIFNTTDGNALLLLL